MIEVQLVPVVLAGVISGAIFGFSLISRTEQRENKLNSANNKLFLNSSLNIFIYVVLKAFLLLAFMALPTFFIMKLAGAYPLSQEERYIWVVSCVFATGIAKYLRYLYWKSKKND